MSASSSTSLEKRKPEADNTLLQFAAHTNEIWSIDTIREEILPCLLVYHRKMEERLADLQDSRKGLNAINTELEHVADAIKKFKDWEKMVNEQVRALLPPYLCYIQIEDEESKHKEKMAKYEIEEEESETRHLRPDFISMLNDEMSKAVPKSKGNNIKTPPFPNHEPAVDDADGSQHVPTESSPDGPAADAKVTPPHPQAANADGAQQLLPTESPVRISETEELTKVKRKFDCLDENRKRCFMLLSVFPDDFPVRVTDLTLWWMEEELIPEEFVKRCKIVNNDCRVLRTMIAEEFVRGTLQVFVEKDFIQPVIEKKIVKGYKMYPLVRRIANILAWRDDFIHIDTEGNFQLAESSSKSKTALLLSTKKSSQYEVRNRDPKDFQTIFNVNESLIDMQRLWLSKAKNLRVLQLGSWRLSDDKHTEVTSTDFFKSFQYLTSLRYLSFRRISGIHELPPSMFSKLQELRILDLKACQDLTKIPAGIGMLTNLTHLDMSECYLLQSLPKEIGRLTELQVLKGLVIWDSEFGCKISDLEHLKKLTKLSIFGSMEPDDTDFAGLSNLEELCSLTITWISKGETIQEESSKGSNLLQRSVTKLSKKGISPKRKKVNGSQVSVPVMAGGHTAVTLPNLEKLDLLCYPESKLPPWINCSNFQKLKKLYIRGGKLSCLPDADSADSRWKVETLRLKFLDEMALNWKDLNLQFPDIKYVEKVDCPKLESFPCDDSGIYIWRKLQAV